jgi:hypothetical protein
MNERRNIMNAMNNMLRNSLIVVLLALTGAMQATAVEYKNSYQQSAISGQQSVFGSQPSATAPRATFQSTSAYSEQWSEQATPLLNGDGSVNHEAYMSGSIGPRRSGTNPGTPDDEEDPGEQQPLGDALLPLMLLACAYLSMRVFLKNAR